MRRRPRQAIALLSIAALLAGCSHAVEIPREEFDAASRDASAPHRIRTHHDEYIAAQFSLTDSTLVIGRLSQSDYLYNTRRVPITIARDELVSIERVEPNELVPIVVVASIMALSIAFYGWFHGWGD